MAVALYAVLLRRGVPRWLAALAAAPVLLDAYELQIEQTIMPDVWFEAFIVAGLVTLLWRPRPGLRATVAGGLLLGLSAPVAQVGQILIVPALLYVLIAAGGWRRKLACGAALCVAFAAARAKPPGPPGAPPEAPPKPPPPKVRAPPGVAEPVVWPTDALSGGASLTTRAAPATPSTTPATPPMMPMATDSPITWPMIRRLRQPSALSVPNSRTRRATAAMVSRLASRNAATSTATASHLPRLSARLAALDSDPVTSLARLLDVVTVALGRIVEISLATPLMFEALSAAT